MSDPARRDDQLSWKSSIYAELHALAERELAGEAPGHSMQPTLIVNDAFMRLLEQKNINPSDRSQVMAAGANIIRCLLVDYARSRKAQKRGGAQGRGMSLQIPVADDSKEFDILELNDALEALGRINARAAKVVELKFFGGLSGDDIAQDLRVSLRTVQNDWRFAKAWLYRTLGSDVAGNSRDAHE